MRRNIDCAAAQMSSRSSARATATSASRPAAVARVRGAVEPGAGIERRDHRAQHVDIGMRQRVLTPDPSRDGTGGCSRRRSANSLGMARRGGADALQRVRAPAELLQDGVVGDGAQFARMADARRAHHAVGLPRRRARAGLVEQRRAEGAEQRGIAGVIDQRLHAGADGGEEVGGEVGIGVDRILDRAGRGMIGLLARCR